MANGVREASIRISSCSCRAQIYFKSWDGTVNGSPPTGGGGGLGVSICQTIQPIHMNFELACRDCK